MHLRFSIYKTDAQESAEPRAEALNSGSKSRVKYHDQNPDLSLKTYPEKL